MMLLPTADGIFAEGGSNTLIYIEFTSLVALVAVPLSYNSELDRSSRLFILQQPLDFKCIFMSKYILGVTYTLICSISVFAIFMITDRDVAFRCVFISIIVSLISSGLYIVLFYLFDYYIAFFSTIIMVYAIEYVCTLTEDMPVDGQKMSVIIIGILLFLSNVLFFSLMLFIIKLFNRGKLLCK